MTKEFHYKERDWNELKRRLPEKWIPVEAFVKESLAITEPHDLQFEVDLYNEVGPECIYVWGSKDRKKVIAHKLINGNECIDCREWFLEVFRPDLQYSNLHNVSKAFVPAGEREDLLERCSKKFQNLQKFVLDLPEHVRRELNDGLYDAGILNLEVLKRLESKRQKLNEAELAELDTRSKLTQGKSLDLEDLEFLLSKLVVASKIKLGAIDKKIEVFGHNFYRAIFLNTMLRKYLKVYGELPAHTFKRPENSSERRFIGAAMKFCRVAGFSDRNLESELSAAKQAISAQVLP